MKKYSIPRQLTFRQLVIVLSAVLIVALGLRVVMVTQSVVERPLRADAGEYYLYTANLKNYGVYSVSNNILKDLEKTNPPQPDARRPPGYAFFLYPFFDHPPTKEMIDEVLIVQAVISTLTVLIAFFLYQSFLSWEGALVASLFTALSPHLIAANIYLLTETLFTFFLVGFAYVFSKLVDSNNYKWAIVGGVLLGCTMLIKPTMNYFFIILAASLFLFYSTRQAIKIATLLLVGCYVIYGPWIVRNSLSIDDSQQSSKAIDSIHKGMYPNIMYKDDWKSYGNPERFDPGWSERRDYKAVLSELGRRFSDEPLRHAQWYLLGKPITLLSWNMIADMGDVYIYPVRISPYFTSNLFSLTHQLMHWLHWPLVIFALFALVMVWLPSSKNILSNRQHLVAKFCSILIIYFLCIHMVGLPLPRYAVPLKPVIYGLSMLGVHLLVVLLKTKWAGGSIHNTQV